MWMGNEVSSIPDSPSVIDDQPANPTDNQAIIKSIEQVNTIHIALILSIDTVNTRILWIISHLIALIIIDS